MFIKKTNTLCNNILFISGMILLMHETMTRLYTAAREIRNIRGGQSSLATFLNCSPQTLNNWEARGMSQKGIFEMSKKLGCNAAWLKTGEGEMRRELDAPPTSNNDALRPLSQALIDEVRLADKAGVADESLRALIALLKSLRGKSQVQTSIGPDLLDAG